MNRGVLAALLAALQAVREVQDSQHDGICWNVCCESPQGYRGAMWNWLQQVPAHWPEYSGEVGYPVPSGKPNVSAALAFLRASDEGSMWDESTEYGQARYRLLDFLIERCEAGLKGVQP